MSPYFGGALRAGKAELVFLDARIRKHDGEGVASKDDGRGGGSKDDGRRGESKDDGRRGGQG